MKTKFKDLNVKDKVSLVLCVLAFIFGAALTLVGLIVEPQGEIHPSVITTFGMFLTFCGSILGISQHYKLELEKLKMQVGKEIQP